MINNRQLTKDSMCRKMDVLNSFLFNFTIVTLLLCCASVNAQQIDAIQSTYVVLGENGAAFVRLLTTDAKCPVIQFDGFNAQMDIRAVPETVPLRPTLSAPTDSKPSVFPLLTCEKAIPPYTKTAMIRNKHLPLPVTEFKRIVVIGDTGCRLKKSDNAYQDCNDSKLYPFARVAEAAAKWKPDLVVHVGDFQYRENECPANKPGCAGSPWGYGWDTWNADFFGPGEALLKAAPWVMVRGNHESCARAGQGWWRMLDPRPLLTGRDCNSAANDEVGDFSDPYAIPLGGDAQLIVLDTSNTINGIIQTSDIRQTKYRDMYNKLEKLSQQATYNIAANHHPILGFAAKKVKRGEVTLLPGNQGIQSVFAAINPLIMPPRVNALLSGHVHLWEEVSFSSPHPTQFIAGFSGTMEDVVPLPAEIPVGISPAPGAVVEHISSWVNGFGYMTMERKGPKQWEVKVWDTDGHEVNACNVEGSHSNCKMAQVN